MPTAALVAFWLDGWGSTPGAAPGVGRPVMFAEDGSVGFTESAAIVLEESAGSVWQDQSALTFTDSALTFTERTSIEGAG